jgi:NADH dehydrogenase/NADH:ubiquinone oxidoreductase subunit G
MRAVLTKGEVIVVTFKVNRRTLRVEEGTTVLEAARDAGIYIPTLCYHPALEPIGACRLCIVELSQGGRQSHVAACVTKVSEGITVKTDTQAVAKIRRTVLELLIARCPDVAILRELGERFGVGEPSFPLGKDVCFLCGLCVRACREIVGVEAIGFAQRGVDSEVLPPFATQSARCISCGTCTTVCPARTFDLSKVDAGGGLHGEKDDVRVRKCVVCDEHYSSS